MADIINLRQARKAKARQAATEEGGRARAKHGQSKPEKAKSADAKARLDRTLDGARRLPPVPDDESPGG